MDKRAYNWFLTINNPTQDELDYALTFEEPSYLMVADETGEQGTRHLHLYIEYKCQKSFKKMKKTFPRANIQIAKGDADDNAVYLSKQNLVREFGNRKKQGKRTDLDVVREVVEETNSMREVVRVAQSYQSVRMAECILKYHEKPRNWKPEVKWFWGPTGTGKSKTAYEELGEDCYTCLSTGKWFDGYDNHENVLIDDMRRDFMKFHELLRLLDRYAMRVECKGGSRQFRAKKIIITSAFHPETLFETREDVQQLIRRIDCIRTFTCPAGMVTNYAPQGW